MGGRQRQRGSIGGQRDLVTDTTVAPATTATRSAPVAPVRPRYAPRSWAMEDRRWRRSRGRAARHPVVLWNGTAGPVRSQRAPMMTRFVTQHEPCA